MNLDNYVTDACDNVYEWSETNQAWIFIGKKNGRTLREFLADFFESEYL